MKNENEFNAYLSKEFRKRRNTWFLGFKKLSERFEAGASDFLLVKNGQTILLECKFIKDLPVLPKTQILGHPFTGPQLKFMDDLIMGGANCYGLVAIGSLKMMAVFPRGWLEAGNWTKEDFLYSVNIAGRGNLMGWDKIDLFLHTMAGTGAHRHHVQHHCGLDLRVLVG